MSWNLGPAYQIAEKWAKERAVDTGTTRMLDNLSIFHLPVGVRPSDELKDNYNISFTTPNPDPEAENDGKALPVVNSSISSWSAFMDFYNNAVTTLKGKYVEVPKQQGVLSVRAASMLVICR